MPPWDKLILVVRSPAAVVGAMIGAIAMYVWATADSVGCELWTFTPIERGLLTVSQYECMRRGAFAIFFGAVIGGGIVGFVEFFRQE